MLIWANFSAKNPPITGIPLWNTSFKKLGTNDKNQDAGNRG
jgi:hypothetical protein